MLDAPSRHTNLGSRITPRSWHAKRLPSPSFTTAIFILGMKGLYNKRYWERHEWYSLQALFETSANTVTWCLLLETSMRRSSGHDCEGV